MKKILLIIVSFLSLQLGAQDYRTAIGARLGFPLSFSLKHFISEPGAVELTAGFRFWQYYRSINVGGYYEHHFDIAAVDGLRWYIGGGANAYFWSFDNVWMGTNDYAKVSLGLSAMAGLDYKFENAPVNLSVDWIPTIFIGGYTKGFGGGYGALAIRYTLK